MKPVLVFLFVISFVNSNELNSVDLDSRYSLHWEIKNDEIIFEVTAQTTGFIGLGLSWQGKMEDADIFVAGVYDNGTGYLMDMHGIGIVRPVLDVQQDLKLLNSSQNNTHTYVKFSRKLITCDKNDLPIKDETAKIIWSFGSTDTLIYHESNRGVRSLNLFDGPPPNPDLSIYKVWNVTNNIMMPINDTTYWCSFHKAPTLKTKHHLIGFEVFLDGADAKEHTHHADLYKCVVPEGQNSDDVFGEHAASGGQECYYDPKPYPREHCEMLEFSWEIGGNLMMFPDNVGVPFGLVKDEYFMLELHYDNPNMEQKKFETGIRFYYTEKLRPKDAGFLMVKKHSNYKLLIPPNATDFLIPAHCSSHCTNDFPKDGLNVFNVKVHSHLGGRKMKVRHFRNGNELPWIVNDEHYDFNYQQNKMLKEELKLLPGDHLTLECVYDSNWKKGEITLGGLSTREEMCIAHLLYYPLFPNFQECGSNYPPDTLLNMFGIEKIEQVMFHADPVVVSPPLLAGQMYSEIVQSWKWNDETRAQFQKWNKELDQEVFCGPIKNLKTTNYPSHAKVYAEKDQCESSAIGIELTLFVKLAVILFFFFVNNL